MDSSELVHRSIQEAFSRALSSDSEDAYDRRDRLLASALRKISEHFPDTALLSAAANLALTPFSPCLPLALACHIFAGARGSDYFQAPDSCKVLLEMGADPFARSSAPSHGSSPSGSHLPGRFIFGTDELNAFEIALAKSDGALILTCASRAQTEDFLPQHWTAFELFTDLVEPMGTRCEEVMRALAERGFFSAVIAGTEPASENGKRGGKRL